MPNFTWDVDPVLFHFPSWLAFLPVDGIRYYSLLYVGVFLGGHKLLDWQIQRAGGDEEQANDFLLYGVIAVLGGARMGHVFFYEWERFLDDPMWLFMIHKGGLASHGAVAGIFVAMWVFTKLRRQSLVEGCDRLAISGALGAILVRAGNFFNSEIVGRETHADWGIRFPRYDRMADAPLRHPSQLYEMFLGVVVLVTLIVADRLAGKEKRPRGLMLGLFMLVYFSGRFAVEYFKEYQTLEKGSWLTMGQWLSLIPALVGAWLLLRCVIKRTPAEWRVFTVPSDASFDDDDDSESADGDDDVDDVLLDRG